MHCFDIDGCFNVFFLHFIIQVFEYLVKVIENIGIQITTQNYKVLKQCIKDRTPKVLTMLIGTVFDSHYIFFMNIEFIKYIIHISYVFFFLAVTCPSEKKTNNKGNNHYFTDLKAAGFHPSIGAYGYIEWCKKKR